MIKTMLKLIIGWRLYIALVSLIAIQLIAFKPTFPYAAELLEPTGHPLFWGLANFDGVHYLGIADKGYFAQFTQAFFPLYPIVMNLVDKLFHNLILSGLLISHVSLIIFAIVLYRLVLLDHQKVVAESTLLFYLVFPTSFFFAALYTESMFMALVVGTFLAARKKRWLLAGILGGFASATRLFGVLLLPALIIEFWQQHQSKNILATIRSKWRELIGITLSASGLLAYMRYLATNFSDPLYFLHAQPVFGAQRTADKIILLYQVFWRYTKMMVTVEPLSLLYYTVTQEFFLSLTFLVLLIIAARKIRLSYIVFGALAYILPTLTGTLSSQPRYLLIVFPAFIILGQIKNKKIRFLLYALSSLLLAINLSLFTRGYWVS
ncbi:MAG: glycosyltransferase family 39 protein [Candidatus Chisholmbacteria bacterium]|nr:glycosyltransferase family 39 protein [Candidatus Chisholmbacteria bacterium]